MTSVSGLGYSSMQGLSVGGVKDQEGRGHVIQTERERRRKEDEQWETGTTARFHLQCPQTSVRMK